MKAIIRIAVFCSFLGIFTALVYKGLRFGLTDSFLDVTILRVLGLLFFFVFVPIHLHRKRGNNKSLYEQLSIQHLLLITSTVFIGVFLKYVAFTFLTWIFSLTGLIFFAFYLVEFVKESKWIDYAIGIPFLFVFAFCNTSVLYANFAKPEFFEALVAGNVPFTWRTDTFFHSSFAQMINSYWVPTTGLSGTPLINYHFGSHFIFIALANVLNIDALEFYTLGYPVIFTSLLFYVFLLFILQVMRFFKGEIEKEVELGFRFWMLFMGTYLGFITRSFVWDNNLQSIVPGIVGDSGMTTSESYLFSMILLFIFLIVVIAAIQDEKILRGNYFLFAFLPLMVFITGLTKISTGYIMACVIIFVFLRYSLFRNTVSILSFALCMISYYCSYLIVRDTSYKHQTDFYFFKHYSIAQLIGFFILFYFWNYVLMLIFIAKEKAFSLHDLKRIVHSKKGILIEICLVIALAGIAPIAVLKLGVNGEFFTEVQFFVSIGLVVGYVSSLPLPLFWIMLKPNFKKVVLVVVLVLLWDTFYSTGHPYMRTMVDVNFNFRKKILKDSSSTNVRLDITQYIREARFADLDSIVSIYGKPVQASLNENFEYNFLKNLRRLNSIDVNEKQKSLVYVNYKNSQLKFDLQCFDIVFLVPALSGMAQLNGMYVKEECDWKGWGFEYYKPRSKEESLKKHSDSELCKETLKHGFSQLFIYRPERNDFELLHCN